MEHLENAQNNSEMIIYTTADAQWGWAGLSRRNSIIGAKNRPKGKLTVMSKPMGVSAYKVTSSLPEELQRQLPSIEDIEKRIQKG